MNAPEEIDLPPVDDAKTSEWIVVLAAAGLNYRLSYAAGQWAIHVPETEFESATRELTAYEEEFRAWERARLEPPEPWVRGDDSWSPVWVAATLIACYAWLGSYGEGRAPALAAAMDTDRFFAGEWWRAITALTVHSDLGHLAGNVACILLFGHVACQAFGAGLSWMLILACGLVGNAAAAWLHGPGHVSVGASTACFGALGLLSASQAIRNLRQFGFSPGIRRRAWLPVGAGVALLTLLGTGPQSDLLAHLFGFAAGLAVCLPFLRQGLPHLSPGAQQALQLLALAILMTALRLVLAR